MNNILIYSDLHISQSSAKECIMILEEIGMLANKYNCDTLINLGDTFDCPKPSSLELDILATFINRLGNDKYHIIIAAASHESTTQEQSILNHYGILSHSIRVVKEYKDSDHMYCGHFILKESSKNYGATISKEAFKKYLYVFLGHQHSYEMIKSNCVQLGSCRFVDFAEASDKCKIVALITDYGENTEKAHFLKLISPIPMVQIELSTKPQIDQHNEASNPKELIPEGESALNPGQNRAISELITKLDKLPPKTKVKVKILDFESFRLFLPLVNRYTSKFEMFKYDTSFEVISANSNKSLSTETKSFKESFNNWLSKQENLDLKIKEILLKEIE
jgi:DNA repair exonuclease SbcCD nuclease subunit